MNRTIKTLFIALVVLSVAAAIVHHSPSFENLMRLIHGQ